MRIPCGALHSAKPSTDLDFHMLPNLASDLFSEYMFLEVDMTFNKVLVSL